MSGILYSRAGRGRSASIRAALVVVLTSLVLVSCPDAGLDGTDLPDPDEAGSIPPPVLSRISGTYTEDFSLTISTHIDDAEIRYTTDGNDPDRDSTRYTGPIRIGGDGTVITVKAITITKFGSRSAAASETYRIAYGNRAIDPVFSPNGGTQTPETEVTITSATEGAVIRYTTDGSDPDENAPVYDGPIPLSDLVEAGFEGEVTIRAQATHAGLEPSGIVTARFTIDPDQEPPLPAPGNLTVEAVNSTTVRLRWDGEDAMEYHFRRSGSPDGPWSEPVGPVGYLMPPLYMYVEENLTPGGTYYYQVRGTGGQGETAWTGPVPVSLPSTIVTDGRGILFGSYRDPVPVMPYEGAMAQVLMLTDRTGAGPVQLTTYVYEGSDWVLEYYRGADWSPDGREIVYTYEVGENYRTTALMVMNADASGKRIIRTKGSDEPMNGELAWPAWSPDGSRIVFVEEDEYGDGIVSVEPDGSDELRLTPRSGEMFEELRGYKSPVWSPDSGSIAYIENGEIRVMNADGSGKRTILSGEFTVTDLDWASSDRILYASNEFGRSDIFVVNPDGSGAVRLTTGSSGGGNPVWSPDGTMIAFETSRDGNSEIYVMNADGSDPRNISNHPENDSMPGW